MEDYISILKYKILRAREEMKMAEAKIEAFETALNEYEKLLYLKEYEENRKEK